MFNNHLHTCVVASMLLLLLSRFSHPTFCNPLDCSPPGSSVHGILQSRILEWVANSSSKDLPAQGSNPHLLWLLSCRQIPHPRATREAVASIFGALNLAYLGTFLCFTVVGGKRQNLIVLIDCFDFEDATALTE